MWMERKNGEITLLFWHTPQHSWLLNVLIEGLTPSFFQKENLFFITALICFNLLVRIFLDASSQSKPGSLKNWQCILGHKRKWIISLYRFSSVLLIQTIPRKKLYTEPLGSEHIQGLSRKASENTEDAVELHEDLREYLCVSPQSPTSGRIEISEPAYCQFSLITTHKSEFYKLFLQVHV